MTTYSVGTVTVTNGDATIVGDGTLFLANVSIGDTFSIIPLSGFAVSYVVASITDDLNLELSVPYGEATTVGQAYVIARDFTPNLSLPRLATGDLGTATAYTRAMDIIDLNITPAVTVYLPLVINAQTAVAYTVAPSDGGNFVSMDNALPNVVTLPNDSTVIPIGTEVIIQQRGLGTTSIIGEVPVVVNSAGGFLNLANPFDAITCIKYASDNWTIVGNLN